MSERIKNSFKHGVIPFFVMIIFVSLTIMLSNLIKSLNETEIQVVSYVADEETNPSYGRLIYCLSSFVVSFILITIAKIIYESKYNIMLLTWTISVIGGTMIWQSVGEYSWHYGLWVRTEEGDYIFENFPRIESFQGFQLLIPLLILFFYIRNKIDFCVLTYIATFLSNWLGHILLIGTYHIAINFKLSMDILTWFKISGIVNAVIFFIIGTILILSDKTSKETKYISTLCWYIGVGDIVFGIAGLH